MRNAGSRGVTLWINQDGGGKAVSRWRPCIGPLPVAGQTSGSPSGTDSISTYRFRTNDLSKLEVRRLRKPIALISELTNKAVFLSTAWSSKLNDDHSGGSVMRGHFVFPVLGEGYRQGLHSVYCPQQPLTDFAMCAVGRVTIGMLPDYALLETFHFYKDDGDFFSNGFDFTQVWKWETLTQVCRRWRRVVFGSPRRLNLRLVCTSTTPTSKLLDIWPPFPIVVLLSSIFPEVDENGVENLIAALKCRDRISEICIYDIDGPLLEKLALMLHGSLPVLTHFALTSTDESVPVLPETFLGGFAPRLRSFGLSGIPFWISDTFVLSVTHVEFLSLLDIPNSGYISPEAMVTFLAALPNLKHLFIGFLSPLSRPIQISPPPLTRSVLPALTDLHFHGISEYLEDFVARIETPLLNQLSVVLFMDLIFLIPRLHDFICRTEGLMPCNQAYMEFTGSMIKITLGLPARFVMEVRCQRPDWQLSSMTQIFGQQWPLLSHIEQLEIREGFLPKYTRWKGDPDMDSSLWLGLFHLFIAVQSLYVSEILAPPVAAALQELSEGRTMEVLPALRNLSLEGLQPAGPVQKAIQFFIASRQVSGHPIVIQNWERQLPVDYYLDDDR